jgi:rhodanese-related sulfurtransferase
VIGGRRLSSRLGLIALVLAAAAMVSDLMASVTVVEVSPIQLARWIRDRRPGLDVIDVRRADEYETGHIPGARNVTAPQPGTVDATVGTVVLYDQDGRNVRELAAALSPGAEAPVYVLEGGIDGWVDTVMAPRLRADASDEEQAAFAERAELSRWFGGLPRVMPAGVPEEDTESAGARSRRLLSGC